MRVVLLTALIAAFWPVEAAKRVQLVFTPAVLQQAVALKDTLMVDKIESFNALGLVGASADKRRAYSDKVADSTAVVILGEDALKAVADLEFTVPVVLVNATGPTAAKNRVFRVFDGTAPGGAAAVNSSLAVSEMMAANQHELLLKGHAGPVVQIILGALK